MFEEVGQAGEESDGPKVGDVVRAVLRSPLTQGLVGLVAAGSIMSAIYGTWIYRLALSPECAEVQKVDLSMDEIIALKRRRERYQRNPLPDAHLELTGSELSFLLRNKAYAFKIYLELFDNEVTVRGSLPREQGGCYNLAFHGRMTVVQGVARMHPNSLVIGEADLTSWANWYTGDEGILLFSKDMPDPRSADLLANITSMRIEAGMAIVQVRDRYQPF